MTEESGYDVLLAKIRPPEPGAGEVVWYRGWEVGYNPDADYWASEGWQGYKGGCDLDAEQVMARTYELCLDEIDGEEDQ